MKILTFGKSVAWLVAECQWDITQRGSRVDVLRLFSKKEKAPYKNQNFIKFYKNVICFSCSSQNIFSNL